MISEKKQGHSFTSSLISNNPRRLLMADLCANEDIDGIKDLLKCDTCEACMEIEAYWKQWLEDVGPVRPKTFDC